ncbi:MAG TPA: enoyl-CoA hydratase-related protein [Vicinamibacterales bacterium]
MKPPVRVVLADDRSRAALRIFHPKGNLITLQMIEALAAGLAALGGERHLKLITIEGEGQDFSFGASIPEHGPGEIERVLPEAHRLTMTLLDAPAPTAAVVRGRCLGGGFELALACDFIFASDAATFGLPEVGLGVFPPAAAALLPHRVGTANATRAIVTGAPASPAEWFTAGLVTCVAADGELAGAVDRWFDAHLASKSASALRHCSRAARAALRRDVAALLPELERLYLDELMRTHDAREGVAAFLEKRAPQWTDR